MRMKKIEKHTFDVIILITNYLVKIKKGVFRTMHYFNNNYEYIYKFLKYESRIEQQ